MLFIFLQSPDIRSLTWSKPHAQTSDPDFVIRLLIQTLYSDLWFKFHNKIPDPDFVTRFLVQALCSDLWSRDDVLPLYAFHPMPSRNRNYYLLWTLFIYFCALTIPSEVQAVQDVINPLINHALTSDHSSRSCIYPTRLSRVTSRPSSTRLCYQAHCLR